MKYNFITALILLSWVITVRAQVSVEVTGGVNLANLSDPGNLADGATWKTRPGFVGTAGVSIHVYQRFSILPGLRYIQKGTNVDLSWPFPIQGNSSITLRYIELPLYVQWQIADIGSQFFITGGPTISYLLSSRIEAHSQFGITSRDPSNDYKHYDASFDLGLSAHSPVTNSFAVVLTGMYSYGFVKISSRGAQEQTRDARFTLGIAYALNK